MDVAELFDFEAGEAGDDSAFSGVGIQCANALLRGRAVEDHNGSGMQIRPESQDGLRGEFGHMHGGIEARRFWVGAHARFSASQAVWAVQVEAGGLRSIDVTGDVTGDVLGEKRSRWRWTL